MNNQAPHRLTLFTLLGISVLAMSVAAPLIRIAAAPALVIAFWRMGFSTLLTGGFWVGTKKGSPPETPGIMGGKRLLLLALSGLLLGIHFATWIASLSLTSVAASVVLVNTQPLFVAFLAPIFLQEKISLRQGLGSFVAIVGALVIFMDSGAGETSLTGNLLALIGAVTAAGYYVIGRALRPGTTLWAYVTPVYGISALFLLGCCLLWQEPLFSHPAGDWLIFLALAAGPSLLGHTLLNWALRWLPAPVVNLVPLGEPIGATILAAILPMIGEIPGAWTLGGGLLTLAGIGMALSATRKK